MTTYYATVKSHSNTSFIDVLSGAKTLKGAMTIATKKWGGGFSYEVLEVGVLHDRHGVNQQAVAVKQRAMCSAKWRDV